MIGPTTLVRRTTHLLRPDPRRVITRLFQPGQEIVAHGISRVDSVIQRVLGMSDEEVSVALAAILRRFTARHHDLHTTFAEHFALVADHLPKTVDVTVERCDLIGAYFTKEYSVEGAALFNPSIVVHPDQSGLTDGELRFIMSVRALGEGHISSIEFRTGVFTGSDDVRIDNLGPHLVTGQTTPATMPREFLRDALAERADAASADYLLSLLPAQFDASHLAAAITSVEGDKLARESAKEIIKEIRWIASCNYRLQFSHDRPLSERVIYPTCLAESHGMEDARFTRFIEDDGRVTYYATYTAYDGSRVKPHLLQTNGFHTFNITQLIGPAAHNKGMALFPRRVNGEYLALSRWDRENISIASSTDTRKWGGAVAVQVPEQPWELIQLGNCGSPIETTEGWLVLTHGVGPMREYGIGAILLDLDDPTKMIGALSQPLLTPNEEERDGYSPNVVYSCGALLHQETLLLPYGCSDSTIRMALVHVPELMNQLRASR